MQGSFTKNQTVPSIVQILLGHSLLGVVLLLDEGRVGQVQQPDDEHGNQISRRKPRRKTAALHYCLCLERVQGKRILFQERRVQKTDLRKGGNFFQCFSFRCLQSFCLFHRRNVFNFSGKVLYGLPFETIGKKDATHHFLLEIQGS